MSRVELVECEQGSLEWFYARLGIPTASMFQTLLTGSEGRLTYMRKLAGERITYEPASTFQNEDMQRGIRMEPQIRAFYEMYRGVTVRKVGFVRNGKFGASTDGLVGDKGVAEFKSTEPHLLIPMLEAAKKHPGGVQRFPGKFRAQCQGALLATDREWCDLVVYWPKMPQLVIRETRDSLYLRDLNDAIDVFDLDLRRLVGKLRSY